MKPVIVIIFAYPWLKSESLLKWDVRGLHNSSLIVCMWTDELENFTIHYFEIQDYADNEGAT